MHLFIFFCAEKGKVGEEKRVGVIFSFQKQGSVSQSSVTGENMDT